MKTMQIHPDDNVAVALTDLTIGEAGATAAIPAAHKLAIRPVRRGATVIKYGQPIGVATTDIAAGEWVHVHNLAKIGRASCRERV